jgi:hypothetical protein
LHTNELWQWVANSVPKELISLLGRVPFTPPYAFKALLMTLVVGPLGRVSEGGRNWEGRLPLSILLCPDPVLLYLYRIFK